MATVKTISTTEAMRMVDETASHQLERICKETASISELYRSSGLEDIQRMQRDVEKLGFGVAPLIRDLEQQMTKFNCGIADRLKDFAVPEIKMPTEAATFFDNMATLQKSMPSLLPMDSMIEAATKPYKENLISPADIAIRVQPVTDRFKNLSNVVETSLEELGERIEQRMKADAAASQNQMMQVGAMIDTLVKITAATSQEGTAATKRTTRLAIIMTIAAICQCLIPLLMHYVLKGN
jgi:hypothetical protein